MADPQDPNDPKNPDALTDDGRAPVLGEDQAQDPPTIPGSDSDAAKAIPQPLEENDLNAQPG